MELKLPALWPEISLFITTCIAIVDFAQVLWIHQALSEQVRNAVRWGMVQPSGASEQIKNMVLYRDTVAGTNAFLGLTPDNVQVTYTPGTAANPNDGRLQVAIVDFRYHIFTPGIARTFINNSAIVQTATILP